jgi:hypothetical protein
MNDRPRFRLELVAGPSAYPPVVRLRRFLKLALRAFNLRCTKAEALEADGEGALELDAEALAE